MMAFCDKDGWYPANHAKDKGYENVNVIMCDYMLVARQLIDQFDGKEAKTTYFKSRQSYNRLMSGMLILTILKIEK